MKADQRAHRPQRPVVLPQNSVKSDWEVRARRGHRQQGALHVSEADALAHVAGYCVVNDVSGAKYQIERGGTWDNGQGCDTFGPVGPWLVTALMRWATRRTFRCSSKSTATASRTAGHQTMIFGVAQLVSYEPLHDAGPGDLISTGTPPGVGMGVKPPGVP